MRCLVPCYPSGSRITPKGFAGDHTQKTASSTTLLAYQNSTPQMITNDNSIEKRTLRIGDRLIVLDGVNPLRFVYINDPQKSLYQFDEWGNILFSGEYLNG